MRARRVMPAKAMEVKDILMHDILGAHKLHKLSWPSGVRCVSPRAKVCVSRTIM